MSRISPLVVGLVLLGSGCSSPVPDETGLTQGAPFKMEETGYRITGPYVHEDLALYLVHSDEADNREFITLDEGLEKNWVEVTEKAEEQVSELQIENRSDKPLFLQEGDRLTGGKQDRIIGLSMVIPARSGKVEVPAFCVEQSRWSRGTLGGKFTSTANSALASQTVRFASKVAGDQGSVWFEVAEQKGALESRGVANNTSSLNEAMDSEAMRKVSDAYEKELGGIFAEHEDAIGVAFVLGGKILEVDIYPGNALLRKISPRLLRAYAIQANSGAISEEKKGLPPPEPSEIAKFMKEGVQKSTRTREIDDGNRLRIVQYEKKVSCDTLFRGDPVHLQWLAGKEPVRHPRGGLGNEQQIREE